MHCGTRAHATKACKIEVHAVINKIACHKRAHTRVFSTRVCKVDTELYCRYKVVYYIVYGVYKWLSKLFSCFMSFLLFCYVI